MTPINQTKQFGNAIATVPREVSHDAIPFVGQLGRLISPAIFIRHPTTPSSLSSCCLLGVGSAAKRQLLVARFNFDRHCHRRRDDQRFVLFLASVVAPFSIEYRSFEEITTRPCISFKYPSGNCIFVLGAGARHCFATWTTAHLSLFVRVCSAPVRLKWKDQVDTKSFIRWRICIITMASKLQSSGQRFLSKSFSFALAAAGRQFPNLPVRYLRSLRDRKLRLQIGLWSLDLKRKFRDVSTNLGQPPSSSTVFTFCFNPRHQQLRKLGECILFVQIVDDSGIPLAESTEIVDMQKLSGTINLSIQESTYITGQKQRQFPLSLQTYQYLSLQELEVPFLAQKWGAEEDVLLFADMFPQPYLPSRYGKAATTSTFATVQDVNLSEVCLLQFACVCVSCGHRTCTFTIPFYCFRIFCSCTRRRRCWSERV